MVVSKQFPVSVLYLLFLFFSLNQLWQPKFSMAAYATNQTDFLSLNAIKDQIEDGLSSWKPSLHFCQWQGITCGKRHQQVISLNLSSQSLVGTLSPHIGNLGFLRYIYLQQNKFHGKIPESVSRLFRLQILDVSENAFEGEIPANLTRCKELRVIQFMRNHFSGNIPPRIGSLPKLAFLNLVSNNLAGVLPPCLGNLSNLKFFDLFGNSLEGNIPESFSKLSSLKTLSLSSNRLSGMVPLSLYNISSIETISMADNQLTGTLPPDLGITLPNLYGFCVGGNRFSGSIPISIANASRITKFDIEGNSFTGQIPSGFGVGQNFHEVKLGYNHLGRGEDGDLSFISCLANSSSNLKKLFLERNNFGGAFPNSTANLSAQMEYLVLGDNQLYGTITEGIGNLVNLISLRLGLNQFSGSIPLSIGNIQKLQELLLPGNKFTGLIPFALGNLTQLSVLSLANNNLHGRIPSSLERCRSLQRLDLSRNHLSGRIPEQVIGISSLSVCLNLSRNSLIGSVPLAVGKLKNLGELDLSNNKLSGKIPSTLDACISLERLHMEENSFEGPIPESLSSLRIIQFINLSRNNLSGKIPKYLGNLPYLGRIDLSSNKLDGEVPMEGVFNNASIVTVAGNSNLCGGISELELPMCSKKHKRSITLILVIVISAGLVFIFALLFLILCLRRNSKLKAHTNLFGGTDALSPRKHLKVSYRDLFEATDGFSGGYFVGSGSFGRVYKGILGQDKMIVAVKVFNLQRQGALKSFMAECESLRNIRHRNLVKIVTSCSTTDFRALVFEFMPNGCLEKWLHKVTNGQDDQSCHLNLLQRLRARLATKQKKKETKADFLTLSNYITKLTSFFLSFSKSKRTFRAIAKRALNIAIDVATALDYLHHQCHVSIIHRDLKPSNVLLDNEMVAHVGDFGLAKLISESTESTSIGVKGSIGYAAPEYGMGGDPSTKGDVYSYGILLLELFTGRRPTDEMFVDGMNMHNFAREALPNRVTEIVETVLFSDNEEAKENEMGIQIVTSVVRIGVACSTQSPVERVNMEEVAKKLHSIRNTFLSG